MVGGESELVVEMVEDGFGSLGVGAIGIGKCFERI